MFPQRWSFLLLLLFCQLSLPALAQNSSSERSFQQQWQKADSLLDKDLPKSAGEVVSDILEMASRQKDRPNRIKAQLYLLEIASITEENADTSIIRRATRRIEQTSGAEKAIWQSITAQLYWNFYQQNRYKILSRTRVEAPASEDMRTWDAAAFFRKIAQLYEASIRHRESLKELSITAYAPLVDEGIHTLHLRPTVYDLLLFRAIAFFEDEEKDLIRPAGRFILSNPVWFADAKTFSQIDLPVKDSLSFQYRALQLYQKVIAFHLQDSDPRALIDADLLRLQFVHTAAVMPEKDSLYLKALSGLAKKYDDIPAVAEISFLIARQQLQQQAPTPDDNPASAAVSESDRNIPAIRKRLEAIVARYPGSEGAVDAYNLLQEINQKTITVKTEEAGLPGKNSKILVGYQNIDQVFLRIYRLPNDVNREHYTGEDDLEALIRQEPVAAWSQSLPGSEDMEAHAVEIKVAPLTPGRYLVVAAARQSLADTQNVVAVTEFQMTQLSLIYNEHQPTGATMWVLNRENGQPVANAQVSFWKHSYQRKGRFYRWEKTASRRSAADGSVEAPAIAANRYAYRMRVIAAGDTFWSSGGVRPYYRRVAARDREQVRTFFFTDRSIYRPGQTVYFKGIMVRTLNHRRDHEVVANQKTTVTFYDANNQKITSEVVTTNEFGSFAGSFVAPDAGLTGRMTLRNATGSVSISVEEYKRPKFFVAFDSLQQDVTLGERVSVTGRAEAYAGNSIDGAHVSYRVVRRTRFPYYWAYYRWGMPTTTQMEIANGTTETDADGTFTINFQAIPDRSIDPKTLPVFRYTVSVSVTDRNGETRTGRQELQIGYRSMEITAAVPETARPEALDTIRVSSRNLNGVFIPMALHLTVAPLQAPGKIYKKRLWPVPDQFIMTESEFRKAFPNDEYRHESDWHFWPEATAVFTKDFTTSPGGGVSVPKDVWQKSGWYVLTFSGKDTQGQTVKEKKYVYVAGEDRQNDLIVKPFLITSNKSEFHPGDSVRLNIQTGFEHAYILQNSTLADAPATVTSGARLLDRVITEKDRGGIACSWLYIYHNRVYTATKMLSVPWDNKELQLEWATHRDKVKPGSEEQWTLTIKGSRQEKVAAELLAGLYDASLDLFRPHRWHWDALLPALDFNPRWEAFGFDASYGHLLSSWPVGDRKTYDKAYPKLSLPDIFHRLNRRGIYYMAADRISENKIRPSAGRTKTQAVMGAAAPSPAPGQEVSADTALIRVPQIPVREDFRETAFFFPQLHTDSAGNVQFSFTLPEALTTWKFMAFAHTKDWRTGYLEGTIKTQKDLMVLPNLPRFFRQGDHIVIQSKISNLAETTLSGTATLTIQNALTLQPLDLPFRLEQPQQRFRVAPGQSTTASWTIDVPESLYVPVIVQVTAHAGNFTDGVSHPVPVVTNRVLVTETLPLPMRGSGTKNFSFDKLIASGVNSGDDTIETLVHHSLTVEYTGNPAWYAVQALPYLMAYPFDCAEQVFDRFYANAIAGKIVAASPKIAEVFQQWQQTDREALQSNLEKNQSLKSALLEATPWVLEAKNETERKHRIAELFDAGQLSRDLRKSLDQLEQLQLPDGSFPWFKGMKGNRYITQYIITGMGKLQQLAIRNSQTGRADRVITNGLQYLDEQIQKDYEKLVASGTDLSDQQLSYLQIQYLYMRSFFPKHPIAAAHQKAVDYYTNQAMRYWSGFNPYMKGMLAIAFDRKGAAEVARQIMASLKETAIHNDRLGMYWKTMPHGYWWYQAPIAAQALLIEAFSEVAEDASAVAELKTWLLKQKQTQNWGNTKSTADAVYALLLQGGDWLSYQPEVTIQLGQKTIHASPSGTEAGTGYFKEVISGQAVQPEMGNISVTVADGSGAAEKEVPVSWGAVYWQYFENMDKVTAAATPLRLEKELYIERNTPRGPVLTEIKPDNALKVGDKVVIRLVLRVDRDMEYVHLKDMRASCFEPVNVLSGYRYRGGLGYYESTRDLSSNFFFDYLPKGTYVFEYPVFVAQSGDFSNGIATIQCMYAPEFSSHSSGIRVTVVP